VPARLATTGPILDHPTTVAEEVLLMRGVLLGSALLALILTVLIVGVVRLTGMVVRRIRGRTKNLTTERRFADAVAAGDFDGAELQAGLLLEPPAGPAARSPQPPPKPERKPQDGSTLLLPPLSNPPFRNRRCVHGMAGGCLACRAFGRGWGVG
jgi:hypothetical protein